MIREEILNADTEQPAVAIYLVPFHRAEISSAGQLLTLLHTSADRMSAFVDVEWDKALSWLHRQTQAELAAEQEAAVKLALTEKVAVLTGGPGLREKLHGALDRRPRYGETRQDRVSRPHRASRQALG